MSAVGFDQTHWRLNPGLRRSHFDGKNSNQSRLLELDGSDGSTRRFVISERMDALLDEIAAGRSPEELLRSLSTDGLSAAVIDRIRQLLEQVIIPGGVLIAPGESAASDPPAMRKPAYMTAMLPLIGPRVINALGPWLQWLFAPKALLIGAMLGIAGLMLLVQGLRSPPLSFGFSSAQLLTIGALCAAGLLLHELGHAISAYRYGARRVDIGVGWYIVLPVAYADLSEAWRFTRLQRAVVDLAGIHMQCLWLFVLMLCYLVDGGAIYLAAATATGLSTLWNINPLIRMDGYWLITDLLGVTQLGDEAKSALRSLIADWRCPSTRELASNWRPYALAGYAVFSSVFFVFLVVWSINKFALAFGWTFPALWQRLHDADWGALALSDVAVMLISTGWNCLLLMMLGRFLWRTIGKAVQIVRGHAARIAG